MIRVRGSLPAEKAVEFFDVRLAMFAHSKDGKTFGGRTTNLQSPINESPDSEFKGGGISDTLPSSPNLVDKESWNRGTRETSTSIKTTIIKRIKGGRILVVWYGKESFCFKQKQPWESVIALCFSSGGPTQNVHP